ncbi:polysaccharide biosynthesis/export family protein [Acidithiobacillus ferrooxidans]|uniref:polysaccharide biosynthesis/export family protein n=1 Tax=Acidithiobacillus ferrooxidans TaxID=920 RepID=UPI001D009097|nr:polysaccharide biosynthesis/export family protein [Acidithiobacillus ferrooxidans]
MTTLLLGITGCASYMPYSGPRASSMDDVAHNKAMSEIQLVDVNYAISHYLKEKIERPRLNLLKDFINPNPLRYTVGPGDTLQVYLWEAPPAMLFATGTASMSIPSGSIMTSIPAQMVGSDGDIVMPFAGKIPCTGKTLNEIGAEIRDRLIHMAHDPQVVVRLVKNHAQSITVVGNVKNSTMVPMIPGGVSVLQALAVAGGVVKPVNKVTIQLSRSGKVLQLPLEEIIRNPREDISLRGGDVLTALYKPLQVTVMGAAKETKEVAFQASGISLAQALAQAGGLDGNQADAKAVFVFRFEKPSLLPHWPKPVQLTANGKVPVVFRFDFSDPATLFAAQTFPIQNHDLIYVASAPITDLQKFLGLIVQIVYPIQGLTTAGVVP